MSGETKVVQTHFSLASRICNISKSYELTRMLVDRTLNQSYTKAYIDKENQKIWAAT